MGFFSEKQVNPVTGAFTFPGIAQGLGGILGNQVQTGQNPDGTPNYSLGWLAPFDPNNGAREKEAAGVQVGYNPGTGKVDYNPRMQRAYDAWQPWNGGTQYMADYITNKSGPSPQIQNWANNIGQYGGMGGYPTDLMHSMAQFGGTGGAGNRALGNALQFGAPSAAGQYVSNMAQFGTPGAAGSYMTNRASGGPTSAMSYLMPFMQMAGRGASYQTPSTPTRQIYRNDGGGPVRVSPPVGFNLPGPYGANPNTVHTMG